MNKTGHKEVNNPLPNEIENMSMNEIDSWIDEVSKPELIKDFQEDANDFNKDLGWPYED